MIKIFSSDKVNRSAQTPNVLIVSIGFFHMQFSTSIPKRNFCFPIQVVRPQNAASSESSDDNNFMFMTMLLILALTLYVFRPMARRRQVDSSSNKASGSGEVRMNGFIWKWMPNPNVFFSFLYVEWWSRTATTGYTLANVILRTLLVVYFKLNSPRNGQQYLHLFSIF